MLNIKVGDVVHDPTGPVTYMTATLGLHLILITLDGESQGIAFESPWQIYDYAIAGWKLPDDFIKIRTTIIWEVLARQTIHKNKSEYEQAGLEAWYDSILS